MTVPRLECVKKAGFGIKKIKGKKRKTVCFFPSIPVLPRSDSAGYPRYDVI